MLFDMAIHTSSGRRSVGIWKNIFPRYTTVVSSSIAKA